MEDHKLVFALPFKKKKYFFLPFQSCCSVKVLFYLYATSFIYHDSPLFSALDCFDLLTVLLVLCSGMGPDSRVLVRKSRKQAQQYYRLYKVLF